ncbi:hypothetical protein ACO0OE_003981 [Hanseniaspora uvarum]
MKYLSTTFFLAALGRLGLAQNVTVTETVTLPEMTVTITEFPILTDSSSTLAFSSIGNLTASSIQQAYPLTRPAFPPLPLNQQLVSLLIQESSTLVDPTSFVVPIPPITWSTKTVFSDTTLLSTTTSCSGDACLSNKTVTASEETTLFLTTTTCSGKSCITLAPVSSEIKYSLMSSANNTTPIFIPPTFPKEKNVLNSTYYSNASAAKSYSTEEMTENIANVINTKNLISMFGAAVLAAFF